MNQEYSVKTEEPPTKEIKPHEIVTTQQRAGEYSKERLEQILEDLEERGLRNTAPYRVFQELLDYHQKNKQACF